MVNKIPPPSSIVYSNFTGPHDDSKNTRDYIRKSGGFFPEQQTFLGASIVSFNIQSGTGSSPATLNVELIEDPNGTNPTVDDTSKSRGVYDPYHHNKTYDQFSPPGVGMPVFFVYSNPRITIKEAYDPSYTVKSYESALKFGGLLQSFHSTKSISGRTYSVTVVDPREILSNVYLILNHIDTKVGLNENNVMNVFGFLEHNPTESTRGMMPGTKNYLRRNSDGSNFAGDDMYYSQLPTVGTDFVNYNEYFAGSGYTERFPITGTGMARRSVGGMPYYRIMQAIAAMHKSHPPEYTGYVGNVYYRGLKYYIKANSLPPLHPMFFFDHDNIDMLSFLVEAGEATGYELVVSLEPDFSGKGGTTNTDIYGGTIVLDFINRSNESAVGQIRDFIDNPANFPSELYKTSSGSYAKSKIISKEDIGYEMTNPTTSKVVFGANRVDMYAFTSNHDDGRWNILSNGQGGSPSVFNQIIPYYGLLGENVIAPVKYHGDWRQVLLDSSGVGAFGVGNYYVATDTEFRYALKGFNSWKTFLEFYSSKFLDVLNDDAKAKYQDVLLFGKNDGLKVTDDEHGEHWKCLKAPRCLFTNDVGFKNFGGQPYLINPCCPPYGYPLYYNRAIAIGLTLKQVFDDRSSVIADLNLLLASGDDNVSLQKVINGLLEKYKNLRKVRRLSRPELDAIKILNSQGANFDAQYLNKVITSLSSQLYVPAKNQAIRKENAEKVYSFVRNIAEECYGKKWLVRIPTKPNYRFEADNKTTGIDLSSNNRLYQNGFFGFPPSGETPTNPKSACPSNFSFITTANDPDITSTQAQFHYALVTNYNPIDDNLVTNYIPDNNGGFIHYEMYLKGVNTCMIPADLTSFGTSHRIRAYVRYDHAEKLNVTGSNSKVYTEYVGTNVNRINSVPSKIETVDDFTQNTYSGTMVAFIPVDLDTKFYYPPSQITRSVPTFGNWTVKTMYTPEPVYLDASGNVPPSAGNLKSSTQFIPNFSSVGNVNIVDYYRNNYGMILPYPDIRFAYALITMQEPVTLKSEKLSDIPKRQRYSVATYPGYFSDEQTLNTVKSIKVNRRLDFNNYGSSLTFYNPDKLFSVPRAVKPDIVVLPLENQQVCYGPWYNGPIRYKDDNNQYKWKILKNLGGKVDIQNDGSLAPWNYGSYELMDYSANIQAQLCDTLYLASEKGSVTFPGLPMGKTDIGWMLATGGPIMDSISLDVGVDGVTTSYRFQTYSRSFASIQKQQQKQIDILKRSSLKSSQDRFELLHKGLLKQKYGQQFSGMRPSKPYSSPPEPQSQYQSDLSMASVNQTSSNSNARLMNGADISESASIGSSPVLQDAFIQENDTLSQARDFGNSAIENISDKQIAISNQAHPLMPNVRQADLEQIEDLYTSPTDLYRLDSSHRITYWR